MASRRAGVLVAAMLLLLVAASCSDDDSDRATGDSAGSTTTAAPTTAAPTTTTVAVEPAVTPTGRAVDGTLSTPDGRTRTYHLYVPPTVAIGDGAEPVPLLLALHGGTGWGSQFELNSGFDGLAEANGFIVVYPDGVGTGADGTALRTWNGGMCCGPAVRQDVDDVTFIRLLVERLRDTQPIDPNRVYAAGHSNGGILAYRLACELSGEIAGIGVQSTSLGIRPCRPDQPVSVLHIHGTADRNIPIDGGEGPDAIAGVAFEPPIDGVRALAEADGCDAEPAEETDGDLIRQVWSGCEEGTSVEFLTVTGASHAWMGHDVGNGPNADPYMDLDSSETIWAFLAAHPR